VREALSSRPDNVSFCVSTGYLLNRSICFKRLELNELKMEDIRGIGKLGQTIKIIKFIITVFAQLKTSLSTSSDLIFLNPGKWIEKYFTRVSRTSFRTEPVSMILFIFSQDEEKKAARISDISGPA